MLMSFASRTRVVDGHSLAAIYDFSRSRIQRIPLDFLHEIEAGSISARHARAASELADMGFLVRCDAASPPPAFDGAYLDLPAIRMVSIDACALEAHSVAEDLLEFLSLCCRHGLRDVLLLTQPSLTQAAAGFIRDARRQLPDVRFEFGSTALPSGNGGVAHQAQPTRHAPPLSEPVRPGHFRIDWTYFELLKKRSESDGCMHIDPDLLVSPDICERDVRFELPRLLDSLQTGGLRSIALEHYWGLGKDARGKCSSCEFRYACPNGKWSRSIDGDLNSPPVNCSYDPVAGTWL